MSSSSGLRPLAIKRAGSRAPRKMGLSSAAEADRSTALRRAVNDDAVAHFLLLALSPAAPVSGSGDHSGLEQCGSGGRGKRLAVVPSSQFLLRWSWPRKAKCKSSVSVAARGNKTAETSGYGSDHLPIYDLEPKLAEFKDHFNYTMKRYLEQKLLIEKHEGGLEEFSKGYLKFGINTEHGASVYREWAPAAEEAQLVGEFNNWNGSGHKMIKDNFGVWSIRISHVNGKPAIPHNSKVKFRFRHDGIWVERIPAWIHYATVTASKSGATYDGLHWDPPTSERYVFNHPRPRKPDVPRIYEVHVGVSGEKLQVATYREFADNVLPCLRATNYNTVQLMAIMEHADSASFGYYVTNFFAVSSRSGTPEDLKYLIDKAHSFGLCVLMDVVHSHASNNVFDGLNGYDVGQSAHESYFYTGDKGYNKMWNGRMFNYANWEVLRFLLSNLRYWMDEFMFDGFRFVGVTSMLYNHNGINMPFTGNYKEYFGLDTNVDAFVYMMLANHLVHKLFPKAIVVAVDVSGMPVLCWPVDEGGLGFDYHQAMTIPDRWIDYVENNGDQQWSMSSVISQTLTNRRYPEKFIAYAERQNHSIIGDKTMAFLLMEWEMYSGMGMEPYAPSIDRGIAFQKMIHFITMAFGGDSYFKFMGNEYMNAFDQEMDTLDDKCYLLSSSKQTAHDMNEEEKVTNYTIFG